MEENESRGKLFLGAETDSRCYLETGMGVGRRGSDAVGGHPTTMEGGWGRGQGWDAPGALRRQGGAKAEVCVPGGNGMQEIGASTAFSSFQSLVRRAGL